jgi:O-antigen/teichoic acid export membrane protein
LSHGALLRKLTGQSVVYGLGQAGARAVQMVLVPVFTHEFAPAEYGVIDVLALVTWIATFFVVMGSDAALARLFYEPEDTLGRQTLVSTLAAWRLGIALTVAGLLYVLAPILSRAILQSPDYVKYVRIAAMSLPFTVIVFFQNDVLRVTFQPWKFIVLNILETALVTGLSILFVVGMHREVAGVFYGRLAGDALAAAVGLVLIRHSLVPRFDRRMLAGALRFGLPLVPAGLAFWAISYADRWFLLRFTDLAAVGVYAVAVKLGTLMMFGISAFQLAWGPFAYAHEHDPNARGLFARVLTLYAAVASGIALLLGLFAPELLARLVPSSYEGAAIPGALLVFGVVAFGGYTVAGLGSNLAHRTRNQSYAALGASLVTVALAWALVGPLRLVGVAIATLAGFAASTILLYVLSQRVYPIAYRGLRALSLFVLALLLWVGAAHGSVPVRIAAFLGYAVVALFLARRMPGGPDGPTAIALPDPSPTPSETI